jgi:hypothetical protein
MAEINVNLIRDRVMAKGLRKGVFWAMLAYLTFCGVGLAVVVHRAALRFVDATEQHRETRVINQQFRGNHPNEQGMQSYAQNLRERITLTANVLSGIDAGFKQNVSLPRILLGLAKPLPQGCVLLSVTLEVKKKTIQFSVMAEDRKSQSVSAGQIIDHWTQDGMLGTQLKDIRAVSSQSEYRTGRRVRVHKFSAKLDQSAGGSDQWI